MRDDSYTPMVYLPREMQAHIEQSYTLRDRATVLDFLGSHPRLAPVLLDLSALIPEYFPGSPRYLRIVDTATTRDAPDGKRLVLFIATDLDDEEANRRMDQLMDAWLPDVRARGGKAFSVAFVLGTTAADLEASVQQFSRLHGSIPMAHGDLVRRLLDADPGSREEGIARAEFGMVLEETFHQDMEKVVRRLREAYVYGAEAEKIRHAIRETRRHSVIANLEARLVETEDRYWATIAAINESFVNIPESLVRQYPMLLSGGMWGTIELTYDETQIFDKKIRPFKVLGFTPFQVSVINLDEYLQKRREFGDDEWIDILINSCGLNPATMDRRQKLLYLCRCIPLVETNYNMIELAPRETGKTYLYRNISYYAHVLSGGKATPAQLFVNLNTGKIGEVGVRDAVVFDEIANTDFTDPRAFVSIMQGYMQDAKFSRGKKELLAFGSLVFVGNIDVQGGRPHEKYYHLLEPLPGFLQVIAFLDRIHGYLPGWELPKLSPTSYARDYGFIADYFCEIMHELRRLDLLGSVRSRFALIDGAHTEQGVSGRDQRAILKTASGLLKLLYPHGEVGDPALEEVLALACEFRQRVRDQLHLIAPGEYDRVALGVQMTGSGTRIVPHLPESGRIQRVLARQEPAVGEVTGLAVVGDHGTILSFEMQATKGHGRIVPLGSIQRVMRESIEAAAQYIKAHTRDLGVSDTWRESYDVAVLATFMGLPKEGPSAGVTIVTGIVSALTGRRVRGDLAMTGEITIMGRVLPVAGIQQKVRAAHDAGIKEVALPADNLAEAQLLPAYILDSVTLTPIHAIQQVLDLALLK